MDLRNFGSARRRHQNQPFTKGFIVGDCGSLHEGFARGEDTKAERDRVVSYEIRAEEHC